MDSKYIIKLFQAQTVLDCFTESQLGSISGAMAKLLIPLTDTVNSTLAAAGFPEVQLELGKDENDGSILLTCCTTKVHEFYEYISKIPMINPLPYAEKLLLRLKATLLEVCPALRETDFDTVSIELTGKYGYEGSFMLEVFVTRSDFIWHNLQYV